MSTRQLTFVTLPKMLCVHCIGAELKNLNYTIDLGNVRKSYYYSFFYRKKNYTRKVYVTNVVLLPIF